LRINDAELDVSFLNVLNIFRGITLAKNNVSWPVFHNFSGYPSGIEECLNVKCTLSQPNLIRRARNVFHADPQQRAQGGLVYA
jgi:hypothetical protein